MDATHVAYLALSPVGDFSLIDASTRAAADVGGSTALLVAACVLGAIVGSWLTAVIHRFPRLLDAEFAAEHAALLALMRAAREGEGAEGARREAQGEAADATPGAEAEGAPGLGDSAGPPPTLTAPARCAHCAHELGFVETLPIIGYLLRRGRCGHCGEAIPAYMPLVELGTAVGFALVVHRFGADARAVLGCAGVGLLIALSGIDARTRLLPDRLVLPGLWMGLVASLFGLFTDPASAIIGAAAGYLVPRGLAAVFARITGKEGMGHGDFKLLAMFGAWFGWQMLPAIFTVAVTLGAAWAIVLLLARRGADDRYMPFGPFIAFAGGLLLFVDRLPLLY